MTKAKTMTKIIIIKGRSGLEALEALPRKKSEKKVEETNEDRTKIEKDGSGA
jgi:hypothetical protein